VRCDLGDGDSIEQSFRSAVSLLGGIDILVNNAGVQKRHPCEDFPFKDWQTVIDINLNAVFILSQLAGREMLEQHFGRIINIASMLSFFGGITVPAYAASKGAVA
jgi:2-deoxy-D-gluconate 3-dehydrogenase